MKYIYFSWISNYPTVVSLQLDNGSQYLSLIQTYGNAYGFGIGTNIPTTYEPNYISMKFKI